MTAFDISYRSAHIKSQPKFGTLNICTPTQAYQVDMLVFLEEEFWYGFLFGTNSSKNCVAVQAILLP
jgi:hypothetical protein